LSTHSLLSRRL